MSAESGGVAEWLMAADCKSAGLTPYEGSNPSPTITWWKEPSDERDWEMVGESYDE